MGGFGLSFSALQHDSLDIREIHYQVRRDGSTRIAIGFLFISVSFSIKLYVVL